MCTTWLIDLFKNTGTKSNSCGHSLNLKQFENLIKDFKIVERRGNKAAAAARFFNDPPILSYATNKS